MIKFVSRAVAALGVLAMATGAAVAAPITQSVGSATILGNSYDVSVLFDTATNNSFNALSPTLSFFSLADAQSAGAALKTQFGSSFDWNPFTGVSGGRIAYNVGATTYDYVTLCVTEGGCSSTGATGPFGATRTDSNAFTFIQFVQTRAVPEPLTLSMFGAGIAGAAALRRRKAKKA